MKKSTLITTIAMIVVVVVALSTATYAWFTSSATTTATVSMSTTATSDLTLTAVPSLTSAKSWTDGTTGSGIALTPHQGIFAPETTLATTLAYTASTLPITTANFYKANYTSGTTATQDDASTAWGMDAMRITNTSSADKDHVYLYIVIAVDGSNDDANNLYAAEATSFYLTYVKESGSATTVTNGYGIDDDTITHADDAVLPVGTPEPASGLTSNIVIAGADQTAKNCLTSRPAYDGQKTNFIQAGSANANLGIAAQQYVLVYCVDMGALPISKSIVIGSFTWIDGWAADNAAGNSSFTITYAFTSSTQTITVAA